jgi:DnaJ-class molecular chaperone
MYTVDEIVVCADCKGAGKVEREELTDYHHRFYDEWDEPCGTCGGTGRMWKKTRYVKLTAEELKLREKLPEKEKV